MLSMYSVADATWLDRAGGCPDGLTLGNDDPERDGNAASVNLNRCSM
jgi:hypothetical protein